MRVLLWLVFSRSSFFSGFLFMKIRLVLFIFVVVFAFCVVLPAHISALRRAVLPICVVLPALPWSAWVGLWSVLRGSACAPKRERGVGGFCSLW